MFFGHSREPMPEVRLEGVWREYPGRMCALQGVDLAVRPGEFFAVVGRGGSGKTTLLRLIAGLDRPTRGQILLDGRPADGIPPHRREVAMVFQSPALYPHLRVFDNLAFGLRWRRERRSGASALVETMVPWLRRNMGERRRRVQEVAEVVRVEHLLHRYPSQLSGGERQRVALGRALIRSPSLFLFDEPLASVDITLRSQLRCEIKALHKRLGVTILYVTHDQAEAMSLGERVAVLHEGRVQQVDEPAALCAAPANRWVAELVGTPPMTLVNGRLELPGVFQAAGGWRVQLPQAAWQRLAGLGLGPMCAGWPARAVLLGVPGEGGGRELAGPVSGRVVLVEPLGAGVLVHVEVPGATGRADRLVAWAERGMGIGQRAVVWLDCEHAHWFDASSGQSLGFHRATCKKGG